MIILSLVQQKFILLKKTKYSEADLILQGLSSTGAKVSFIARGALRSKKRFGGGVLEPSHYVLLTYQESSDVGKLNTLQEAQLINGFPGIRKTFDQLELALHGLDCIQKVAMEGDQSSEHLFNLTGHFLKAVEASSNPKILKVHFYLKFLLQQGVVEPEPWMSDFLRTPLQKSFELENHLEVADRHLTLLEKQIQHYLKNAAV